MGRKCIVLPGEGEEMIFELNREWGKENSQSQRVMAEWGIVS